MTKMAWVVRETCMTALSLAIVCVAGGLLMLGLINLAERIAIFMSMPS